MAINSEIVVEKTAAKKSLPLPDTKDVKQAENLKKEAQKYFGQMQRSWFNFARTIYEIRETESYRMLGCDSFKDFCLAEYPTISWPTIVKFVAVVEGWGKLIEAKLDRDDKFQLPAYDSCYRLIVAEKRLPKEEVSKLRKAVLENKLSYHTLIDKLKESLDAARDKLREDVDKSTEAIERQLEEDIKREFKDRDEGDGFMDDDDRHYDDEDEIDEEEEEQVIQKGGFDFDSATTALRSRAKFLYDNLPIVQKKLTSKTISDDTIELAKELESLIETINKFLDRVEIVSGE